MKRQLIKIAVIFVIFLTCSMFYFQWSVREAEKQDQYEEPLFQNNIVIKGIIDDISDSGNHCFNIIYLKSFKSTANYFNPFRKNTYPYSINGRNCEIYSWACVHDVERGDSIIIDSNKRSFLIIKKDTVNNLRSSLSFVDRELNYIKEHSKLKF
ncbi:hypothetical protein [Chryseobacterium gambrini]|uniref:hypothetical protein n=1 Tax=Chryseobacterium gambrini TaxID=373672 RepID=UPI0022F3D9B0|nr:hypothetical protein [Chryseobacterium gambrini]WBX98897.1 hypothetical protein PE065_06465 [Chryseobacterium gambrini]